MRPLTTTSYAILLSVDREEWRREAALIPAYFETFGNRLPAELLEEYDTLVKRLGGATPRP